jgi:hypothetical protein
VARKKTHLVFAKRHEEDSPNIWKKVLWSDETKIELFGHHGKRYVWCKHHPSHNPKSTNRFSSTGSGKLVRLEGMMDGAKYRELLEGNLFQSSRDFRLGRRFTFQQDNDSKHTAKATFKCLGMA